jgi:hypothetical protein
MGTGKAVKLPISRRIQQKLASVFDNKDIRIPDAVNLPSSIDKRRNADVEEFHAKHRAVADFYLARTMQQWVNTKFETCKKNMCDLLKITNDMTPGEDFTQAFDNVVLNYKVTNAQMRVDVDKLRTVLITIGKHSASEAESLIEQARVEGQKPLHLRPSTTTE